LIDLDLPATRVDGGIARLRHEADARFRDVAVLRVLAADGLLSAHAAAASSEVRARLTSAGYEMAWPVVFAQLTRRLELCRGHMACAVSVRHLADDCLDRFYDDVEAVVDDLLTYARKPIANLEAWIASRLTVATVNGHRRWRGRRGALQRPRPPRWLTASLDNDPWLLDLATEVLVWAGNSATAGAELWPLAGWAQRRAMATGDWTGSDVQAVRRDVERVLAAMRHKADWYERYVEVPMGHKRIPILDVANEDTTTSPLPLVPRHERFDARLADLASDAVEALSSLLRAGTEETAAVTGVVQAVFGAGIGAEDLDCPPHSAPSDAEEISALVADPGVVSRIVAVMREIIAERPEFVH
jgi:hypothetical protein